MKRACLVGENQTGEFFIGFVQKFIVISLGISFYIVYLPCFYLNWYIKLCVIEAHHTPL